MEWIFAAWFIFCMAADGRKAAKSEARPVTKEPECGQCKRPGSIIHVTSTVCLDCTIENELKDPLTLDRSGAILKQNRS